MKKYILVLILLLMPISYAHEDKIVDQNNRKSQRINGCDGVKYGYHKNNDTYHFHEVIWNKELSSYEIINPNQEFDKNPCSIIIKEKTEVKFNKCVDGDTAKFTLDDKVITVRLLAVDTPELDHPLPKVKMFSKIASEYTCNTLKNATKIELEYDDNSALTDKYNRHLSWVFVDNELLQNKIIGDGYGKIAYLYGEYKYTSNLYILEDEAAINSKGIWQFSLLELEEDQVSNEEKELSLEEKTEKILYISLVILLTIVTILKAILK